MIKTEEIKQKIAQPYVICPLCEKRINIGVELGILSEQDSIQRFPYPHLYLHGTPLHGMLCYIDKEKKVRSVNGIKSIEICRDSESFKGILSKWTNVT